MAKVSALNNWPARGATGVVGLQGEDAGGGPWLDRQVQLVLNIVANLPHCA